jgi:hypothetical protein
MSPEMVISVCVSRILNVCPSLWVKRQSYILGHIIRKSELMVISPSYKGVEGERVGGSM